MNASGKNQTADGAPDPGSAPGEAPALRPWLEVLLRHDPGFYRESRELVAAASAAGKTPAKLRHLIWLAVDSVVTHLYAPGAALHAEGALAEGATVAEVMETLRIAGFALDRGLRHGLPILMEELRLAGHAAGGLPDADLPPPEDWKAIAGRLSPEFLAAHEAVLHPGGTAALDERERALIALAVESCPAVADPDGIRRHMRRAIELGAGQEEIIEVMQVASLIGMHGLANGLEGMAPALSRRTISGQAPRR